MAISSNFRLYNNNIRKTANQICADHAGEIQQDFQGIIDGQLLTIRTLFKDKGFKPLLNELFQKNDPTFKASQHKYRLSICAEGIRVALSDAPQKFVIIKYGRMQAKMREACKTTLNQLNDKWEEWEDRCHRHTSDKSPLPTASQPSDYQSLRPSTQELSSRSFTVSPSTPDQPREPQRESDDVEWARRKRDYLIQKRALLGLPEYETRLLASLEQCLRDLNQHAEELQIQIQHSILKILRANANE